MSCQLSRLYFFFFNDTATTEIYTLSLHDALPISQAGPHWLRDPQHPVLRLLRRAAALLRDRKSTRLNSSHQIISYAVFCLKKKTDRFGRPSLVLSSSYSRKRYQPRLSHSAHVLAS